MAWLALLGTAYLARFRLSARLPGTLAAICACYVVLALGSLLLLGFDVRGVLGAAGMLVPALVACALAFLRR